MGDVLLRAVNRRNAGMQDFRRVLAAMTFAVFFFAPVAADVKGVRLGVKGAT
jgi:hypothetical protein